MTLFYIENRVFPFVGFENDIMPILLLKIFLSLQLVNLYKILEIHQDFLYHLMVLFVATPTYHLHCLFSKALVVVISTAFSHLPEKCAKFCSKLTRIFYLQAEKTDL